MSVAITRFRRTSPRRCLSKFQSVNFGSIGRRPKNPTFPAIILWRNDCLRWIESFHDAQVLGDKTTVQVSNGPRHRTCPSWVTQCRCATDRSRLVQFPAGLRRAHRAGCQAVTCQFLAPRCSAVSKVQGSKPAPGTNQRDPPLSTASRKPRARVGSRARKRQSCSTGQPTVASSAVKAGNHLPSRASHSCERRGFKRRIVNERCP